MAIRLHLDHNANFDSTASDDESQEAQALGHLFASHAAIALGHARER